jgi:hypothetical protein
MSHLHAAGRLRGEEGVVDLQQVQVEQVRAEEPVLALVALEHLEFIFPAPPAPLVT